MTFLGVMMIILGALYVLTIWGIQIGWLPIWLGIVLIQAAGRLRAGFDKGAVRSAAEGADKLRFYFVLTGIFMILSFALVVLLVLAGVGMAFFGVSRMY